MIISLEEKYSLLLDEKERSEKEQRYHFIYKRVKTDIDKNNILDLK